MSDKPNIVYIFTDQQAAPTMSCAGNEDIHTPAIDQIAENGIRFERAYCTQPLCSPSRASMFTGLMPSDVDMTFIVLTEMNEAGKKRDMGKWFTAHGYECVYGGKWHIPDDAVPDHHSFKRLCERNDHQLADRCVEFLGQKHGSPFFLVASFDNPHNICQWARKQPLPWGTIPEPPSVEHCPSLPKNFAVPPYEPQAIRLETQRVPTIYAMQDCTHDDWRRYRYAYYQLIEKVDRQIQKILDALDANGLLDNTILIFSSDHGDQHGAHQLSQKTFLYEESVRVPFIISWKGVTPAGTVDNTHLVSNGLDLLPTLCDVAQLEQPASLPGLSLKPIIEGHGLADPWRDYLISETHLVPPIYLGTYGYMVRTERYKYVGYNWGRYREQLFDLYQDPGEMVNLAVNNKYNNILETHRNHLHKWLERESVSEA